MILRYETNSASLEQIHSHLIECDDSFSPLLSSRVNLLDYSVKLRQKSVSFEAWHNTVLVGMINAYLNDLEGETAFITNVSVLRQYMGQGIATALLEMCKAHAQARNFRRIRLELFADNSRALRLYSRAGFMTTGGNGEIMLMEFEIAQPLGQRKDHAKQR